MLPVDWITPLKYQVDEIWAPSEYVKEVYVRSGIASEKIVVIPWGIDETICRPQTPPLHLATSKSFRLLFVGGAIGRKGFDTLLAAYLQEFRRDEDVCLVIKDLGTQTFYRGSPLRDALRAAMQDPGAPEILYLDSDLTPGLRASLYTACQVLVAPYRGEGFGLPVLEAMACGLVPVVPRRGPTDDFTRELFTDYLASEVVPTQHDWRLVGQPTELSIEVAELRQVLRKLYEQRETLGERGKLASDFAHQNHSWRKNIFPMMADRLRRLRDDSSPPVRSQPIPRALGARAVVPHRLPITACFLTRNHEACIAEALARVTPFVDQVLIGDLGSSDNTIPIAQEYGAQVIPLPWEDSYSKAYNHLLRRAGSEWNFLLEPGDYLADADWKQLAILMENCSERVRGIQFELVGRPWNAMDGVRLVRNDWRIECVFRGYPTPAPAIHLSDGDLLASGMPLLRDQRIEPVIEHEQLLEKLLQLDLGEHRNESEIRLALAHRRLQEGDWCHAECYLHDGLRLMAPSDPRCADVQGALEKCQQALASLVGFDASVGIAPTQARREFAGASS